MTSGIAVSLAFIFLVLYLEVFVLLELKRFVFWLIDKLDRIISISVDDQKLTYDIAGGDQIVHTYDPAPAARKTFNRIVDALKVG